MKQIERMQQQKQAQFELKFVTLLTTVYSPPYVLLLPRLLKQRTHRKMFDEVEDPAIIDMIPCIIKKCWEKEKKPDLYATPPCHKVRSMKFKLRDLGNRIFNLFKSLNLQM